MSNRLTQEDFLIRLCSKNSYYKNGEFEVISDYKNIYEPILLKNKYGICKASPVSLYDGGNITIKSAIDKTSYCIEQLKDILKDNKYTPLSEFEGYSECYKIENFKEIYEEFKKITEDYITEKI